MTIKDEAEQPAEGWRADRDEFERLRAKHEAGEATWDEVVDAASRMRTKAARPIMRDLRAAGVRGRDLWAELDIKSNPAAIAVLVDHLEVTELPDDVVQLLGNLVAVKPAAAHWEQLKAMYLAPRTAAQKEAAANALSACATRERFEELVALVRDEEGGPTRMFFLRSIVRLDGSAGWDVVESVANHPDVADEATEMLKRRARRLRNST